MKYYCKQCGTEYRYKCGLMETCWCKACGNDDELIYIPDYETPLQYEKRTGKAYPDMGVVFYKLGSTGSWLVGHFRGAKLMVAVEIKNIVIADPPVPPPDDWEPEENI
jgi:hypothetical protein